MRFYKILQAKQCGNAEGLTAYERQFVEYLKKIDIKTLTGVLPLTFTAKGGNAVDWVIYGNDDNGTENLANFIPPAYTYEGFYAIKTLANAQKEPNCILLDTGDYIIFANLTSDLWDIKAFTETGEVISDDRFSGESLIPHQPSQYWFKLTWKPAPANYWYLSVKLDLSRGVVIHLQQPTWIFICSDASNATQFSITPGSTAPDHYIPYQQGVGERTENLLPNVFRQGATNNFISDNRITAVTPILCSVGDTFSVKAEAGFKCAFYLTNEAGYQQFVTDTSFTTENSVYDSGWKITLTKTVTETQAKCIVIMVAYSDDSNLTPSDATQSITLVKGSTAPETFIPYGYQIPIAVSQAGQPDKTVDIYIGDSPLTEGQQVSKTSTGQDIELFEGENVVDTTLYNKPTMEIKYK